MKILPGDLVWWNGVRNNKTITLVISRRPSDVRGFIEEIVFLEDGRPFKRCFSSSRGAHLEKYYDLLAIPASP